MKKTLPFFLIILFLAFILNLNPGPALAEKQLSSTELEIGYPEFGGFKPETVTTPLPQYAKYIFNFLIGISGFIALVVLIMAGYQYLTSAGAPEKIGDAKNKIFSALLGLIILFCSYLILTTINPQLIILRVAPTLPILSSLNSGVYLCTEALPETFNNAWKNILTAKQINDEIVKLPLSEEVLNEKKEELKRISEELDSYLKTISEYCYVVTHKSDIRSELDNKVTYIYFVPGTYIEDGKGYWHHYGAILYEDRGFIGKSNPIYDHLKRDELTNNVVGRPVSTGGLTDFKPSSIRPFTTRYSYDANWKVTLYEKMNFNTGFSISATDEGHVHQAEYFLCDFYEGEVITGSYYIEKDLTSTQQYSETGGFWSPESIKVEGDILAILSKGERKTQGSDYFFNEKDNNLLDNYNIVKWVTCKEYRQGQPTMPITPLGRLCAEAAADKLVIINAIPY